MARREIRRDLRVPDSKPKRPTGPRLIDKAEETYESLAPGRRDLQVPIFRIKPKRPIGPRIHAEETYKSSVRR